MKIFPSRSVRPVCAPVAALAFAVVLAAPVWAQTPPSVAAASKPASQVLSAAIKTAKASNKNILVHFGASW